MKRVSILSAIAFAMACACPPARADEAATKPATVSVRKLADTLHAVIAGDRDAYIENVMEKLTDARIGSTEAKEAASGVAALPSLPNHAELMRDAAQKIQTTGAEFSYTLRSLTPINPNNGAQTQAEQDGLERVTKNPSEPYYADEQLGGRSYFTAVYADRAGLKSCIECHNQQAKSPRHDWKQGDVMGAIVVRIPLEF